MVHTAKGTTCSDSGFQDLSTDKECSDAVNYAKSFNEYAGYVKSGSWAGTQKGCYIYDTGEMYFNKHSAGNNNADMRSICHKGNY